MRASTACAIFLTSTILCVVPVFALAMSLAANPGQSGILVRMPDAYLDPEVFKVPAEGKAIVADLESMSITLFEDGKASSTYPILSRGRKGTPWETPSGAYSVLTKQKIHFSSLGHVYMPWSMQFYGNFFIHGWPYDAEGNDVPKGYSGGCIRLSTQDAEQVYAFANRDTPVIVRTKDQNDLSGGYYVSSNAEPPTVTATALVVMDLSRGQIVWQKNPNDPFADPLSTKFLAALAALEHMNQYTLRELPKDKPNERTWMGRRSTLPAKDMIAPLLYSRDTEVESFLGSEYGRSSFTRAMQSKARALGMSKTRIKDLGGDATGNQTTAVDMVSLLRGMDQSKRYLLALSTSEVFSVPDAQGEAPAVLANALLVPSAPRGFRGGLATPRSGSALFVFDTEDASGNPRSVAIGIGGSADIARDIASVTGYVTSAIAFVPDAKEAVIDTGDTGFFERVRTVWNRKRIGDMLLGKRANQDIARVQARSIP